MSLTTSYLMRPRKITKWIDRIAVLAYPANTEQLILYRKPSEEEQWQFVSSHILSDLTTKDFARLLTRFFQRKSPAYITGIDISLIMPSSELPFMLQSTGYQLDQFCPSRDHGLLVYLDTNPTDTRRPNQIVIFDIRSLVLPQVLADISRYYRLDITPELLNRDATIAIKWWNYLLNTIELIHRYIPEASFRHSAPMIGMSYFLTKHLKTNDISIPTDYALWSHLHDAIYTYPVQVYARGKLQGKYYLCDANNLYLAVAKDTKLPGTIATSIILPTAQQVINLVRKYICIAFCYVRKCQYPFVYSSTEEQKTNPPDKAWLWLSAKELEIALDYNCLEQVIVIYAFRQSQSLPEYAADCLEKLCELKRTHDKLFYRGLKHILLAALGKFATRGYRTIPMPNYPALSWYGFTPPPTKSKSGFFYAYAFGHTYKIEWGFPTSISAPQIFACITANSRVHMFQLLSGVDKSQIVYRDVDAVIVSDKGYSQLVSNKAIGTEPGKLSVKATGENLEIFAARHYRLGNLHVASGIPIDTIIPGLKENDKSPFCYTSLDQFFPPKNTQILE